MSEASPYATRTSTQYSDEELSDEGESLPPGWFKYFDETYQQHYFYHSGSGKSQWEKPSESSSAKSNITLNDSAYSDLDEFSDVDDDDTSQQDYSNETRWDPSVYGSRLDMPQVLGGKNQDYISLAKEYKVQRSYLSTFSKKSVKCILCDHAIANMTLFPCEHRCLCDQCMTKESICEEEELLVRLGSLNMKENSDLSVINPSSSCNCPLCGSIVKKILPYESGREVNKYWDWCYEISPPLPNGFARGMKQSASALTSVYIEGKEPGSEDIQCNVS